MSNVSLEKNNISQVPIVIGVSGHRDIKECCKQKISKIIIDYILEEIIKIYPNSPLVIMSPLAEGADRLFAYLLDELKTECKAGVDLIVPLPMPVDEYIKDFKTDESKKEFYELLSKAKHYYELPVVKGETEDSIRNIQNCRNKQYEQLGAYIVNKSQIFIVLWDGIFNNLIGGTSNNVKFRLDGIPDEFMNENIFSTKEAAPLYHILTPRTNSELESANYLKANYLYPNYIRNGIKTKYSVNEIETEEIKNLIEKETEKKGKEITHKLCLNIDKLNSDISKQNKKRNNNLDLLEYKLLEEINDSNIKSKIESYSRYFGIIDNLAIKFGRYRNSMIRIIFLFLVIAIFCFQLYIEFLSYPLVLALYPFILVLGMIVFLIAKRKEFDRKHEDYRAIAEGLRIQYYWLLNNINANVSDHYLHKHTGELEWIRQCIRNIQIINNLDPPITMINSEKNQSIADKSSISWINGQLDWFKKKSKGFEIKNNKFEKTSNIFFLVGMSFAVILLLMKIFFSPDDSILTIKESYFHHIFVVIIGTSVAIMAALRGYSDKMSFSEISKQYSRMSNIFNSAQKRIQFKDINYNKNILYYLGKEALIENGDWLLMHRAHPIEPPKG